MRRQRSIESCGVGCTRVQDSGLLCGTVCAVLFGKGEGPTTNGGAASDEAFRKNSPPSQYRFRPRKRRTKPARCAFPRNLRKRRQATGLVSSYSVLRWGGSLQTQEEPKEEGGAERIIELDDGRMIEAEMVLWTAGQAPVVPKSEAGARTALIPRHAVDLSVPPKTICWSDGPV